MKIAFEALIKQTKIKSLVSGDKGVEIILQLQGDNVSDKILNTVNSLQDPTEERMVVIMDEKIEISQEGKEKLEVACKNIKSRLDKMPLKTTMDEGK